MHDEEQPSTEADDRAAEEELKTTAAGWREPLRGTDAEDSGDEVARGAENAADQPGYGREGS